MKIGNTVTVMNEKTFNKDFFDSGSLVEGTYANYKFEDRFQRAVFLASLFKKYFNHKKLLDLGCAKGIFVKACREIGIEAFGTDISEYAISQSLPEVTPYLYNIDLNKDRLPFEDDYFDAVTFMGTICYLSDDSHITSEIRRTLRKGGVLYLTTVFKTMHNDVYRINTHKKKYWIKRFKDNDFVYSEKISAILFCETLKHMDKENRNSGIRISVERQAAEFLIKVFGKRIYPLISFVSNYINDTGELVFIKR